MARLQRKRTFDQRKRRITDTSSSVSDMNDLSTASGEVTAGQSINSEGTSALSSADGKKRVPVGTVTRSSVLANKGMPAFVTRWSWLERSFQFLREVKVELKKVVWPSKKQTIGSTLVVLILVLIISVFLGIVDEVVARIIRLVLQ